MEEKKDYRAELFYEPRNGYDGLSPAGREAMDAYCEQYKRYLDSSRTEREAVRNAVSLAEEAGFVEFRPGMELARAAKSTAPTATKPSCWPSWASGPSPRARS